MLRLKHQGFTLIEVILASLVLAVCIGGAVCSFLLGKEQAGRAGRNTSAMELVRDTLEELRNKVSSSTWAPATEVELSAGVHTAEGFLDISTTELGTNFSGARQYTVTNIDINAAVDTSGDGNAANDVDYKMVTGQVSWTEP
ncbi:MAG: type II secretion system protein [Candidatus Omnitrophota bacterium]